jgi:plasmid stabilization system protein ParE
MPSLSVDIHPEAIAEAQAAYLAELDLAVAAIAENPEMRPRYAHGARRYILHRFPFYLVYRETAGRIESSPWPMADENPDTRKPG